MINIFFFNTSKITFMIFINPNNIISVLIKSLKLKSKFILKLKIQKKKI